MTLQPFGFYKKVKSISDHNLTALAKTQEPHAKLI
jgi:hypothetical protein